MIGQAHLKQELAFVVDIGEFPVFMILVGQRGSGKKLLIDWLGSVMKLPVIRCGISVADVRDVITNGYKHRDQIIYYFPDADKMSNEAKSALLKITEEPPNNCYVFMSIENTSSMPATIISRACVYHMDRYTPQELQGYAKQNGINEVVCNFCDTPGDINVFNTIDPLQFLDYVGLVLDNIAQVTVSNSLKIGNRLALKEDAQGYDLRLFWKAFIYECMIRAEEELPNHVAFDYASGSILTSNYLAELNVRGVNKNMLFLDWVLQIRKEWL